MNALQAILLSSVYYDEAKIQNGKLRTLNCHPGTWAHLTYSVYRLIWPFRN